MRQQKETLDGADDACTLICFDGSGHRPVRDQPRRDAATTRSYKAGIAEAAPIRVPSMAKSDILALRGHAIIQCRCDGTSVDTMEAVVAAS